MRLAVSGRPEPSNLHVHRFLDGIGDLGFSAKHVRNGVAENVARDVVDVLRALRAEQGADPVAGSDRDLSRKSAHVELAVGGIRYRLARAVLRNREVHETVEIGIELYCHKLTLLYFCLSPCSHASVEKVTRV